MMMVGRFAATFVTNAVLEVDGGFGLSSSILLNMIYHMMFVYKEK